MQKHSETEHRERALKMLTAAEEIVTPAAVEDALSQVALAINAYYQDVAYPLVLAVMGGAVVFTGQLLTRLEFPLEFDYIHVTRYGQQLSGGALFWKVAPGIAVAGRHVLVLDDILDEGHTLAEVKRRLLAEGAASVRLAVFADKAIGREKPVAADWVGVSLPNRFVVGYGLDAYGYWRNLPGIWAVNTEL